MRALRIFLIDDDADDRDVFTMILKEIDPEITCETAENGIDGIEWLRLPGYPAPDYIFIDMNMPKMNGMECLTLIRNDDKFKDSKAIMYSTTSESKIVTLCKALGSDDFLMKPTGLDELTRKLTTILHLPG